MAVFAVVCLSDSSEQLEQAIRGAGFEYLRLPSDNFLVQYSGTTKDLSDRLGVSEGTSGNAIVMPVKSYYGRAEATVWEWLEAHWDK